ncbi:aminopeptidase [Cellulomonas sp. NTE-D12]|nr:aminopeptidase [Cellulomonas sp. NTE-D12]
MAGVTATTSNQTQNPNPTQTPALIPTQSTNHTGTVAAAPLDPSFVATLAAGFAADPARLRAQNAVTRTPVGEVAMNHARATSIRTSVSNQLDDWSVANQKKSGRCWLFAALNLLRVGAKQRLGVNEFEFSQNYAMYWDKLERANFFCEDVVATAGEPIDSRLVGFLLQTLLGDGGQWDMAVSVFLKHGVVPKEAMPETQSSSDTDAMNTQLRARLRKGALALRAAVADGGDVAAVKAQILTDVHTILTIHLGTPPTSFDWQWTDDEKQFHRDGVLTPQQFFERYVTLDLTQYVCLVDDPRTEHPKGAALTVANLGNVVGGRQVRYVNAPMATIKELAAASIVSGEPVWFGCDVKPQMHREDGIWAADLFDYSGVYGVDLSTTKEERVVSGESAMTHAMLLTGVDVVDGTPRRWRVENSWGDDKADKGFFTMDDSWFDEYVFEVVVRTDALPEDLRPALTAEPLVLPAWDPMGALA